MLISIHEIKEIYEVCKKLRNEKIKDIMNSKISMEHIRVEVYVEPNEDKIVFIRRLERISTGNFGLQEKWSLDKIHFKAQRKLHFNKEQFLFEQLKEITNE
ncbi:MAG: hypothetical protein H8E98_01960 [Bacteroidetes bacterium]|nr:hypothetical protein [Bacteroidota bacterium]